MRRIVKLYSVLSLVAAGIAIFAIPEEKPVVEKKKLPLQAFCEAHLPFFCKPVETPPPPPKRFFDSNLEISYLMEKVSNSFPRLLVLVNWFRSITVVLHNFIASFFLGNSSSGTGTPLLFKLLLISAVVDKTSLDILILFSWYISISFVKSLQVLCSERIAYARNAGGIPSPRVLRLLQVLSTLNLVCILVCFGLFHTEGLGIVVLLLADCGLLAIEIGTDVLSYLRLSQETEIYSHFIYGLEFGLDVATFLQFLHIWSFHGFQYTIIDCVILLHLHVAASSLSKKIYDRAQSIQLMQQLEDAFESVVVSDDPACNIDCSICYHSLAGSKDAKKLRCGHVYHLNCLKQLVLTEGKNAKCPLCRRRILQTPEPRPALLRISTEGLFPEWLHIPNFTFEIVRRMPDQQRFFFWRNNNNNAEEEM